MDPCRNEESDTRHGGTALQTLDDEEGDDRSTKAEDDEAGDEVAANGRLIGGVLECCPQFLALIGVAFRSHLFSLVQTNPGQEDQRDCGGDEQGDGVDEERGADGPGDNESADGGSRNTPEEKAAVECARRAASLL